MRADHALTKDSGLMEDTVDRAESLTGRCWDTKGRTGRGGIGAQAGPYTHPMALIDPESWALG